MVVTEADSRERCEGVVDTNSENFFGAACVDSKVRLKQLKLVIAMEFSVVWVLNGEGAVLLQLELEFEVEFALTKDVPNDAYEEAAVGDNDD